MKHYLIACLLTLITIKIHAQGPEPFITSWNIESGDTITIPLGSGSYDFDFKWHLITDTAAIMGTHTDADGDFSTVFASAGIYHLEITGIFPHLQGYPKEKLLDVLQWGDIQWENLRSMFHSWPGTHFSAIDTPDFSHVIDMNSMFENAANFNDDLNHWDVSNITSLGHTFRGAKDFNGNISDWDVSSVTFLDATFLFASSFDQDISQWDVSNVTTLENTFRGTPFNRDISGWNVGNVRNMKNTFQNAGQFDQPIGDWDFSQVKSMNFMFSRANKFDQDISQWDVSNVTDFTGQFRDNKALGHSLGSWKFNPEANFSGMFQGATGLDCQSWSATIIGWNFSNAELDSISIGGPNVDYDSIAAIARDELLARGWTINGTETNGDCGAIHPFRCQDITTISNDILFGNLVIGASQQIDLENVDFQKPSDITMVAPEININSSVEIPTGIEVTITSNSNCTITE